MDATEAGDAAASRGGWVVHTLPATLPDEGTQAMLGRLVAASHWNQTADDWRLFVQQGRVVAVRSPAGDIVASGAVLPMDTPVQGPHVAWISMILVLPEVRGQGLGRLVFERCLADARTAGWMPMLDATPQGEPLYRKFGFAALWRLTRWRRDAAVSAGPATARAEAEADALVNRDAAALGFRRAAVLRDLLARKGSRVLESPGGAVLLRAGRAAHHVGPLLADDTLQAAALLTDAVAALGGPVLIDVPDDRPAFAAHLQHLGFAPQRSFARMVLAPAGTQVPHGQVEHLYAVAGPEFA